MICPMCNFKTKIYSVMMTHLISKHHCDMNTAITITLSKFLEQQQYKEGRLKPYTREYH